MSKAVLVNFDQPNPYDSRKVDTLRLVVPIGCTDDPIERLLADISVRFRRFLGKTEDELRFVGLTYSESHVDPTDLIRDILAPGDAIKVQDEKGWVLAQNNYLKSADLSIFQDSFEESADPVSCNVGLDTRNKIYIKMYIGSYKAPKRQSLFFIPLPSDSKASVAPGTAEINAGKGGLCRASWAWGEDGKLTIESQVKSSTDPQPMVKRITSSVVDGKFVMGEVTNIQEPFPKITKIYSVPDPNYQGPTLDAFLAQKPVESTLSTESTGDVLKIEQVEEIQMSENWKSDDTFYNLIYTPLRFTNAADKPVTITEVSGQYQGKDGEPVTMENVFLSMKRGFHDYSRYRTPYNEQIAPESSALFTIEVSIPIKGFPQIDRARRIHSSLPDPFNMTLTVKTSAGQTASIKVTAVNPQLTVTARTEAEKNKSVESFDWWMTCDDTNVMNRVWLGMHHNKENNYLAFHHSLGQGKWVYQKDINEALFGALKEEKREVVIKDLGHQTGDITITAWLVVDLECRCGYAMRFNLKTSTSSLDCYRTLPSEI